MFGFNYIYEYIYENIYENIYEVDIICFVYIEIKLI